MTERIIKDAVRDRYVSADGARELGYLTYTEHGDSVSIDSTVTHPEHRGRGVAARLVRFALDDLRAFTEKRIEPRCSYVVDFIAHHPEFVDLTRRA